MKAADARAVRKQLGCMRRCTATGPRTHHPECPAVGKWLDEAPREMRAREASVPVGDLEALIVKWGPCGDCPATENRSGCAIESAACAVQIECARDLQVLIDKATP
ncbi:MAG: hypothetical protein JWO85_2130 [Candidatus Eremiobacteraeota bacterium]|nr:hypothetical protein [Candidatus Eremiobacteraeota bacterium]